MTQRFNVGFTGTQEGMTAPQKDAVFGELYFVSVLHHGECVGADEEVHGLALLIGGIAILGHPPIDPKKRASLSGFERQYPAKPYLERDHDIAYYSHQLYAAPKGFKEERRSGTWATVRYARKLGKPVTYFWPDGSITFE